MSAEILYSGKLLEKTDEQIKEILRNSFIAAEKTYLNSIDSFVAQKATLQYAIPDISQYEISQKYQEILNGLNAINKELSVGISVVVALMINRKIYIANIGSCRALLCKTDAANILRVIQVTIDHNIFINEEESLRLCQLGLDNNSLRSNLINTRCIGNYLGKSGYKDCEILSESISEPILSDPEIVGSITLDDSCRFLIFLSAGLCQTLIDLYSPDLNIANKELIQIVIEGFKTQSTLMGVAQSTVNRISQLHHDFYMKQVQDGCKSAYNHRDHMSLLLRNFNYPMPNAINKRERFTSESTVTATPTNLSSNGFNTENSVYSNTSTSTSSGRVCVSNSDQKIKPYVDFSEYYKNVEKARFNNELPKHIKFD